MKLRNVAILLAVALLGSCVGCAATASMSARGDYDPTIGGDGWRVMGAELVDNRDVLTGLTLVQADVAACLGMDDPGEPIAKFFVTEAIWFHAGGGRWEPARGMAVTEDRIIYVVRPRSAASAMRAAMTLRHEVVHVLTGLPHPDADAAIAKCARLDWRTQ